MDIAQGRNIIGNIRNQISRIMQLFNKGFSSTTNIIKSGYRSNSFAPYVWITLGVQPFFLPIILISPNVNIQNGFAILDGLIIVAAIFFYGWTLIKRPALLQSEEFRLEEKKLDMVQQKGSDFKIKDFDLSVPQIEEGKTK